MKWLSVIIMCIFMIISMGAVVPKRGINKTVEWYSMTGEGTEENPYRPQHDIYVQDQATENISLFLAQHLAMDLSFAYPCTINQDTVMVNSPTVVPVAGNFICAKEGVHFSQLEILSVADSGGGNYWVLLAIPSDHNFDTSAVVCLQNCNMNINGATTPVRFYISPGGLDSGQQWDITRMLVSMTHASAGDDGLFGNLARLARGVYFRIENGCFDNLFNARENSDFRTEGYDIAYPSRSGGLGNNGTAARITFNGADKRGVVLRLGAADSDKFMAVVRDDISTLTSFRVKVQGHVVD